MARAFVKAPAAHEFVESFAAQHVPTPYEMELIRRGRRRKTVITIGVTLVLGILGSIGVALGAGVGAIAGMVRERWPAEPPSLYAAKLAPPKPADISGPAKACAASSLTLSVGSDRNVVLVGDHVNLQVLVQHTGRYPCLINGGLSNLRLRLLDEHGAVGWSTFDCELSGSRDLLMTTGQEFTWDFNFDGHRTAPGHCTSGQGLVGPGDWQFVASLGEVAHSDSMPLLLTIEAPQIIETPVDVESPIE
jgi:hypothetical protein